MQQEIRFYELSKIQIEKAIPQLLYKIYDSIKQNMILLVETKEQVSIYDKLLWTFSSNKFLPHGTINDSKEEYTPLLVTNQEENLNDSSVIVTNHLPSDDFIAKFNKQIIVFQEEKKTPYLQKFNSLKESSYITNYWKQGLDGKWNKIPG